MEADLARRFGGVTRLYGEQGAQRLQAAHVCVVGIGGVGSWAAEALARTGVGEITLIDLDMIAESNTNRQIHALGEAYGKAKVDAMAERILDINPACRVHRIEDFVTPKNAQVLMNGGFSCVIDAIDQVRVKVSMIAHCRQTGVPIITAGAAGGQLDPTLIRVDDLARTEQDPLLSKVRSRLRKEHGYTRKPGAKFGIAAVYSSEPLRYPVAECTTQSVETGLNCAGFGSSVAVTASFGLTAAAYAMRKIAEKPNPA
ncbi:MAG TPA: tRNA cyclic N6-threonylcarbamoyladenosine(37) synthase TcdA [Rhodocyclaceae bacterium]|nr:tRNA cyclic N6-threonylcarbamoyladenosine(37) synthase TcdA [Rhodocyclaceae bacterium]